MRLRRRALNAALLATLVVAGCATSPPPPLQPLAAGMSRLFVYRTPASEGGANTLDVLVDGQKVGDLPMRSYIVVDLPPGARKVDVAPDTSLKASTEIRLEAGRTHYLHVDLSGIGWNAQIGALWVPVRAGGRTQLTERPADIALSQIQGLTRR